MPPWCDVSADIDVVCKLHQRLSDVYPVQEIDVVVVGIFHQVGHKPLIILPLLGHLAQECHKMQQSNPKS